MTLRGTWWRHGTMLRILLIQIQMYVHEYNI
jgi:hypothetical protein